MMILFLKNGVYNQKVPNSTAGDSHKLELIGHLYDVDIF